MGNIHVGQTALDITRTLGVDITGATETLLKFIKPSLVEGQWIATVDDALTGQITFSPTLITDLNEYGNWRVWGKITFSDGTIAESDTTTMFVHKAGQL